MHQRRFGSLDGMVYIVRAGGVDGGNWLVGAATVIRRAVYADGRKWGTYAGSSEVIVCPDEATNSLLMKRPVGCL